MGFRNFENEKNFFFVSVSCLNRCVNNRGDNQMPLMQICHSFLILAKVMSVFTMISSKNRPNISSTFSSHKSERKSDMHSIINNRRLIVFRQSMIHQCYQIIPHSVVHQAGRPRVVSRWTNTFHLTILLSIVLNCHCEQSVYEKAYKIYWYKYTVTVVYVYYCLISIIHVTCYARWGPDLKMNSILSFYA